MAPYREASVEQLICPRCKKQKLPPLAVATCACGSWVSRFAASVVLTATDVRPNRVTRWWRVREPCPVCGEQMALHGDAPGLLQGCTLHGYWIDTDTVEHTGLARGVDHEALDRKRASADQMEEEREQLALDRAQIAQRAEEARRRSETAAAEAANARELQRRQAMLWAEGELFETLDGPGRMLLERILLLEEANRALVARLAELERSVAR